MDTNTLITLHDGLEAMMAQGIIDYFHLSTTTHTPDDRSVRVSTEKNDSWKVYHSDTKGHEVDDSGWEHYPLDVILSKCYEIVEATTAKGDF